MICKVNTRLTTIASNRRHHGWRKTLGAGRSGMTAALDRSFDWAARFVAEVPAAVALFDRDLCYAAASPAWVAAFRLGRIKFLGRRHGELCELGRAALEEVQRRGLAGEPVEDYRIADDEPASRP